MTDTIKGFLLLFFMLFIIATLGAWITILAVNTLFGLNIPLNFETILSVAWITMTLKGIFSPTLDIRK